MEKNKLIKKNKRILDQIAKSRWYHGFEILPGIFTPGQCRINPQEYLNAFNIRKNLYNLKALDIGTWDGPIAFELERRGAKVTALDIQDPDHTGFNTAKKILKSRVKYVRGSVYELSHLLNDKFDIVCYFGVFYHLKHPLLGFEEIAKIIKPKVGRLYIEGEILKNYAETLSGIPVVDKFVSSIAHSDLPLTLCYPGIYKGNTNWFVPNLACFKGWLISTGFELLSNTFNNNEPKSINRPWLYSIGQKVTHLVKIKIKTEQIPDQRIIATARLIGKQKIEHGMM